MDTGLNNYNWSSRLLTCIFSASLLSFVSVYPLLYSWLRANWTLQNSTAFQLKANKKKISVCTLFFFFFLSISGLQKCLAPLSYLLKCAKDCSLAVKPTGTAHITSIQLNQTSVSLCMHTTYQEWSKAPAGSWPLPRCWWETIRWSGPNPCQEDANNSLVWVVIGPEEMWPGRLWGADPQPARAKHAVFSIKNCKTCSTHRSDSRLPKRNKALDWTNQLYCDLKT